MKEYLYYHEENNRWHMISELDFNATEQLRLTAFGWVLLTYGNVGILYDFTDWMKYNDNKNCPVVAVSQLLRDFLISEERQYEVIKKRKEKLS